MNEEYDGGHYVALWDSVFDMCFSESVLPILTYIVLYVKRLFKAWMCPFSLRSRSFFK